MFIGEGERASGKRFVVTGVLEPLGAWEGGDMAQRISDRLELRARPGRYGMKVRAGTEKRADGGGREKSCSPESFLSGASAELGSPWRPWNQHC